MPGPHRKTVIIALFFLFGCSTNGGQPRGEAADASAFEGDEEGTSLLDSKDHYEVSPLLDNETDVSEPWPPWGQENRGYKHLRGIIHAHSIYSHDGCAQDAPPLGSEASLKCLAEMRLAPCIAGIDFIMQTDHPANVKDVSFLDALHYDKEAQDAIMKDELERPLANRVKCPKESLVDHFYFFVGTEGGQKNMPVALSGPIPEEIFSTGYEDEVPLEKAQAAVARCHELGGVALAAHTEEDSISVERIVNLPLDGMEIYNFHANTLEALQKFDRLLLLDRFMQEGGPPADLALLTFLTPIKKDIEKFNKAAPLLHLVHIAANDVHRNVEFPALCPEGLEEGNLCSNLAQSGYPAFGAFLTVGGPIILNDGDRLDSYARSYRWFSNHLFVRADDPDLIRKSLREGHHFSAFDGFGLPQGFDFFAAKEGKVLEMGGEVLFEQGYRLYIRAPKVVAPLWATPSGIDYSLAKVTCRLTRASLDGPQILVETKAQGEEVVYEVEGPGAYWVACDIVPEHFRSVLEGHSDVVALASNTYPYLYSNAIFFREGRDGQY